MKIQTTKWNEFYFIFCNVLLFSDTLDDIWNVSSMLSTEWKSYTVKQSLAYWSGKLRKIATLLGRFDITVAKENVNNTI